MSEKTQKQPEHVSSLYGEEYYISGGDVIKLETKKRELETENKFLKELIRETLKIDLFPKRSKMELYEE